MDFKEVFLKLTEYTIPHGEEDSLAYLLPDGIKKDKWGNYFIKVGESKTLFTCHLDTYCEEKEKINHVIDGNIIKTDETTILGGDNKAGVTVILYMISQGVPGIYYFFLSEEPISKAGGLFGSTNLLDGNPAFLKQFDRAVAFDRKHYGSIITRQMAQYCCSQEFADALCGEFAKNGVPMTKDESGYYTDTGNFIEVIPECTNVSVGVWNEHHFNEYVDIAYVEKVAKAACKVKWEELPTVRNAGPWIKNEPDRVTKGVVKKYVQHYTSKLDRKIYQQVHRLLRGSYVLMNKRPFESGKEMWYNSWFKETPIRLVINNEKIVINNKQYTLSQLKKIFKEEG